MTSRRSSKFDQIPQLIVELAALEYLKNLKRDSSFFISNEFSFRPNWLKGCGVSCLIIFTLFSIVNTCVFIFDQIVFIFGSNKEIQSIAN